MATNKRFVRKLLRTRNRIESKGRRLAFKAIQAQYKEILSQIDTVAPEYLLGLKISQKPFEKFFTDYYPMFAEIGMMQRSRAMSQVKSVESEFYEATYFRKLRSIALVEAGKKVTGMTATSEKFIRGAIESAVAEGAELGLGVPEVQRRIRKYLIDSLGDIGRSRARMIAQTEMIVASNQASHTAMEDTGLKYRKFWSATGDRTTRASHAFAEQNHPNGIAREQYFDMGNGNLMLHVGDPNGPAEEVINCRCATIYEAYR